MPDVVPQSCRSFQKLDGSGLGVFGGLATLGLGPAEDDVANDVHQADGDQVVPGHGGATKLKYLLNDHP